MSRWLVWLATNTTGPGDRFEVVEALRPPGLVWLHVSGVSTAALQARVRARWADVVRAQPVGNSRGGSAPARELTAERGVRDRPRQSRPRDSIFISRIRALAESV